MLSTINFSKRKTRYGILQSFPYQIVVVGDIPWIVGVVVEVLVNQYRLLFHSYWHQTYMLSV